MTYGAIIFSRKNVEVLLLREDIFDLHVVLITSLSHQHFGRLISGINMMIHPDILL